MGRSVEFSAIVLAAGLSSRMQGHHKMLLPVGGEAAIRRTVRAVLEAQPQEVVVVAGFEAAGVERALQGLPVRLALNPRFQEGQVTSMAAGVAALGRSAPAVMLCLGDMVLLSGTDYLALAEAFAALEGQSILVPCWQGRQGHPVIFAAAYLPWLGAGTGARGCRHLIAEHADQVHFHATAHDRHVRDMDTPEDYREVLRRIDRCGRES